MSKEVFTVLQKIEDEAEEIVAQAHRDADSIKAEGEKEAKKIIDVTMQKIEALKQNFNKESAAEIERMRDEAAKRLVVAKENITHQAGESYEEAIKLVVKECLNHGRR